MADFATGATRDQVYRRGGWEAQPVRVEFDCPLSHSMSASLAPHTTVITRAGFHVTVSRTKTFAAPPPELADVLHSLGHSCPLGCGRASDELGATVWLTRQGLPVASKGYPTLVVVDSSASFAPPNRSHELVRYVDRCARYDGVRVRERRASDLVTTPVLF